MGSGCGTFASSSPLEGDIDYSHRPKLGADEKVRIGRETILLAQIPHAAFSGYGLLVEGGAGAAN